MEWKEQPDHEKDQLYKQGMECYDKGDWDGAYQALEKLRRSGKSLSREIYEKYPDAMARLARLLEDDVMGTEKDEGEAWRIYCDLHYAGQTAWDYEFVRCIAESKQSANSCKDAIDAIKKMDAKEKIACYKYMVPLFYRYQYCRHWEEFEPWISGAMLELTEENVRKIFSYCLATKDTPPYAVKEVSYVDSMQQKPPEMKFDIIKLCNVVDHIGFLFGQIDVIHQAKKECSMFGVIHWDRDLTLGEGAVRYDGVKWASDNMALAALYYLACAACAIEPFSWNNGNYATSLKSVQPTYLPSDITFEALQYFYQYMKLDDMDMEREGAEHKMCTNARCVKTDFFESLEPHQQQEVKRIVLLREYGEAGFVVKEGKKECYAVRDIKNYLYKLTYKEQEKPADPAVYNDGNVSDANITRVAAGFINFGVREYYFD